MTEDEFEQELSKVRSEVEKELDLLLKGQKIDYKNEIDDSAAELGDLGRNWFGKAIAGAIIADGVISPDEKVYLKLALSFLKSPTEVEKIIGYVKEMKTPPLEDNPMVPVEFKKKMIISLTKILVSDNKLTKDEVAYLKTIAHKLGISTGLLSTIITYAKSLLEVKKASVKSNLIYQKIMQL